MSGKANPKLIGAFVLGAIALAIGAALAFGGTQFFNEKRQYVLFFEGSVGGLNVGAPVNFRGVQLGKVTDIIIRYRDSDKSLIIPVYIEIDVARIQIEGQFIKGTVSTALVDRGLRAQLVTQSLVTGQASVEFDFYPGTEVRLAHLEADVPELPTIPSTMSRLQATVGDIMEKVGKLPLEKIAADIDTTIHSADAALRATESLLKNADGRIDPFLARANATLAKLEALADSLNAEAGPLFTSARGAADEATIVLKTARGAVQGLDKDLDGVGATLEMVRGDYSQDSAMYQQINATLIELRATSAAIRRFAEYLQRNPDALIVGR
jgi:phospholipid/cholesterol/gamma-HCH transport system substrate-binding protein